MRWATVKQIPELYPGLFTKSSIRWLIFNEKQNGFSRCVRRLGKKVLINLDEFEDYIEQKKEKEEPKITAALMTMAKKELKEFEKQSNQDFLRRLKKMLQDMD